MTEELRFLDENLTEIVRAINIYNNEVWFRQYPVPLPLGAPFILPLNKKKIEAKIKDIGQVVLYINIPFCNNQCDYCGLRGVKNISAEKSALYVECLKKEIEFFLKNRKKKIEVFAVLIGGGTPSLLSPTDMKELLVFLKNKFDFSNDSQISIEVSPGDISQKMANILADEGVNRVCVGVQSFNERKLKQCGRRSQKVEHVYRAFENLRKSGIDNIGLDLIFGLDEGEECEDFLKDNLRHIEKIKPTNIDFYSIQNHTKYPGNIKSFSSDEFEKVKKKIFEKLSKWSKRDKFNFSRYFWLRRCRNVDCLSFGAGGKSDLWVDGRYIERINKNNRNNPVEYMNNIKNDLFEYDYAMLNRDRSVRKFIIHNLNLKTGIDKRALGYVYPQSTVVANKIFSKIKDNIIETQNTIKLKSDFEKTLPFKTKNRDVNYFIFSFCFLYSQEDRKLFIESFNKLKAKNF